MYRLKYSIELILINIKLNVKWKEIDEQRPEDINYKKKVDQLEKTMLEPRLGIESFTNSFQTTLESLVKNTIQKVLAEEGKNLSNWYKL